MNNVTQLIPDAAGDLERTLREEERKLAVSPMMQSEGYRGVFEDEIDKLTTQRHETLRTRAALRDQYIADAETRRARYLKIDARKATDIAEYDRLIREAKRFQEAVSKPLTMPDIDIPMKNITPEK